MASHPDYPGATSRIANGKEYWRYRERGTHGRQIALPGQPGAPEFDAAYGRIIQGQGRPMASVSAIESARTFGAAQRLLERSSEWLALDQATHDKNRRMIEIILEARVQHDAPLTWRNTPVEFMTKKHVRLLLEPYKISNPTKAKHLLVALRKLIAIADINEWIEYDPTFGTKISIPKTIGHRKWPRQIREKFEAKHPIGSAARTCYALAFWLGNRRGDIAYLAWDDLVEEEIELPNGEIRRFTVFDFHQRKNRKRSGGAEMFLPVTKLLAEALAPLPRDSNHVLINAYGNPFSEKSLTGMMAHWTKQAGIEPGYTLHGLRRSFASWAAENGCTPLQIQYLMGHSSTREAEPYLREVNKKMMVAQAILDAEEREAERQVNRRRARFQVIR